MVLYIGITTIDPPLVPSERRVRRLLEFVLTHGVQLMSAWVQVSYRTV